MKTAFPRLQLRERLRDDSGQSLVELSLCFCIFTTFLVGAADLALVTRASIAVSNAAKAGAQYAAQNGFTAQDSVGTTNGVSRAAAAEAPNFTLTTTETHSCVCSDGTSSTCLPTDCSNSHVEETVVVNTSTTIKPPMHLPGLPSTWTLSSSATQRCLQ